MAINRRQHALKIVAPALSPATQLTYADARQVLLDRQPEDPINCLRPRLMQDVARQFRAGFPGRILYAVKCNPDPNALRSLWRAGIRHFDVASLNEVQLVRELFPAARLSFMHPVKSRQAIRRAFYDFGVRDFVLDTPDELLKIIEETGASRQLTLFVRLGLPKGQAVCDLSGKFGVALAEAPMLLQQVRKVAAKVGICFHVGSQTMSPHAYQEAIELARQAAEASGVKIDVLDVGGGFPARYPGMEPPAYESFFTEISTAARAVPAFAKAELWCEPGRALVAAAGSVLVRVELRKGNALYLNDGTYGALMDASRLYNWRYPVRVVTPARHGEQMAFSFYGPTCDSYDHMQGPFMLPADVQEGDWLEIGATGAYGQAVRTHFNGFKADDVVLLADNPFAGNAGV